MEMCMRTLPFPKKHVMIFTWACFAFEIGHPPAGGRDAAFYIGVWTQLNFHDFLFFNLIRSASHFIYLIPDQGVCSSDVLFTI